MQDCWHQDPLQRPKFVEVEARLEQMRDARTGLGFDSLHAKDNQNDDYQSIELIELAGAFPEGDSYFLLDD